ncbi:YcjF family protein [Cohaesibacter celericrescens]|uniref:TIGR01620 family protein n=1 Tax=Cohaesibacter celericrescens TaxID=2067669 RepID=A0A2N5XWH6_9HYPH|nr:TIGR01620 family protein [Cohaesibacter celericrescens]PLW75454.1 TIGR01620 family protein [Cohaesibacter celericrescens]PLW78861.1 TIGR01620 family protein [Cohaesibacter celericrescens]
MSKKDPKSGSTPSHSRRAPRAVRLDRGAYGDDIARPTPDTGATISMGSGSNANGSDYFDNTALEEEPAYKPIRKKGWSLASLFWSALTGVLMLALGLWLDTLIRELFARWQYLGWFGIALVSMAVLSLLFFLLRELLALRRLSHLDHLREKVAELYKDGDRKQAMKIANDLLHLYEPQPSLFRARQSLKQDLPHLFDPEDILAQTEQTLMPPVDQAATHRVHQAAKRVAVVTALSPRALFDIIVVLVETVRMVRAIAEAYGNRPGFVAMLRLTGHIAGNLAVTGGMAAGETLMQQIIGHGLAARLSAKLGEGLLNGILTARIGLATIALCRPMPFVTQEQPKLGAVIRTLRATSDEMEGEPVKNKKAKT